MTEKGAKPPLSAAEKQRRYRARRDADPERREKYLQKEREKYREDRESGRKKRINELSESEKRRRRKKWRDTYHMIKDRNEALQHLVTLPHSPLSPEQAVDPQLSTVLKTMFENQDEVFRCKGEIVQLKKQLEQLAILQPQVMLTRTDIQPYSENPLPPQQPDQLPIVENGNTLDSQHVKDEPVDMCITPQLKDDDLSAGTNVNFDSETTSPAECQQFTTFSNVTAKLNGEWNGTDDSLACGQSHIEAGDKGLPCVASRFTRTLN